jgi:hypothetical protein
MCSQARNQVRATRAITKNTKVTKMRHAKALLVNGCPGGFVLVLFVLFVNFLIHRDVVTAQATASLTRQQVLDTMKRATTFMVDKASTKGGYVWSYLPDFSRRWGELEARPTMVWIQPPGTPSMGHLFLDAYHATGDEYYYTVAEKVATALAEAQLESGGWNYVYDTAGEKALRDWYATVGRNAWRLEEFQHYWGNATFDDAGTAEAAKFFLRMYVEKHDGRYRAPLDKAITFVLRSQYPNGGWPQRFPLTHGLLKPGNPDYTSYITFNDDVAAENIEFLTMCYGALGDSRLRDPIGRGMDAFVLMQQRRPQPGWALQYTTDLKPAGARTYEPRALVTHTTATNIERLVQFYRMTGDAKFLARVPEAIDWLEGLTLPAGVAPPGRTHPTFIEIGTNEPLYVHREGSNVFNGRYYIDKNPKNTIAHYSSFRRIDVPRLRKLYSEARALDPAALAKQSPIAPSAARTAPPRLLAAVNDGGDATGVVSSLNAEGYWLAPLGMNSHPYKGDGPSTPVAGDYSQTHVGDESDTSPYPDATIKGISTSAFIRNMSVLIRWLENHSGGTQ